MDRLDSKVTGQSCSVSVLGSLSFWGFVKSNLKRGVLEKNRITKKINIVTTNLSQGN